MSSLIQDYEYDIFISYRHKDNKYDGWVTAFVENLKRELESTFKEDVTIYFDENTNDGLHDTHDVDDSFEAQKSSVWFLYPLFQGRIVTQIVLPGKKSSLPSAILL